jgi:hypothetical protein
MGAPSVGGGVLNSGIDRTLQIVAHLGKQLDVQGLYFIQQNVMTCISCPAKSYAVSSPSIITSNPSATEGFGLFFSLIL